MASDVELEGVLIEEYVLAFLPEMNILFFEPDDGDDSGGDEPGVIAEAVVVDGHARGGFDVNGSFDPRRIGDGVVVEEDWEFLASNRDQQFELISLFSIGPESLGCWAIIVQN